MKIPSLIKNLLLLHEKFSIAGLGTFKTKPKSAEIDVKKGEIKPPSKEIFFDTEAHPTDTYLRDALLSEGYSEEDASKEIAEFVNEVKKGTDNKEKFKISDIGFFYKDEKGIIDFKYIKEDSLAEEAVGMDKVKMSANEVKGVKNLPKKKEEPKDKTKKKTAAKTKQKKTKKPVDKKKRAKVMKTIFIVLPIIALLVLLGFFYKPIFKTVKSWIPEKSSDTLEIVIDKDENNEKDTAKSNNITDYTEDLGKDEEYRKLLDAKISNTANVYLGNNYKKFYIIVNSFQNKEYAENYAQQMRTKGYNPEILNGKEYFRVTIGGYNIADNLIEDYKHYENKFENDIWILVNRE